VNFSWFGAVPKGHADRLLSDEAHAIDDSAFGISANLHVPPPNLGEWVETYPVKLSHLNCLGQAWLKSLVLQQPDFLKPQPILGQ